MSKEDLGLIFAAGTVTYALSFLVNGPLVDKIGGKRGIIIAALGASVANVLLGRADLAHRDGAAAHEHGRRLFHAVCGEHVFPELRRGVHHQGQGVLVPRARTRRVRRDFGTLISIGVYFAFDWGQAIVN
jgi:OPA family glycerol-3-phosphate transporter-like MFS transporter